MKRTPSSDAPFQGAPDSRPKLGVAPQHLFEHRNGAQARCGGNHRDDLGIPDRGERIRTPPPPRDFALGWKPRIGFQSVSGCRAEPRLDRGDRLRLILSELHVEPHLVVGDVAAGHESVLNRVRTKLATRPAATSQTTSLQKAPPPPPNSSRATPSLR